MSEEAKGAAATGPNGGGAPDIKGVAENMGSEEKDASKKSAATGKGVVEIISASMSEDIQLWEEELAVRKEVRNSPITGNFVGAFFVNTYAAWHILVVYLISLESLLSIALSVGMTVCKFLY
jgi:hypothetical protein